MGLARPIQNGESSHEITPEMKAEHLMNAFTNLQAEEAIIRHSLEGARDEQIAKAQRNIELIREIMPISPNAPGRWSSSLLS